MGINTMNMRSNHNIKLSIAKYKHGNLFCELMSTLDTDTLRSKKDFKTLMKVHIKTISDNKRRETSHNLTAENEK